MLGAMRAECPRWIDGSHNFEMASFGRIKLLLKRRKNPRQQPDHDHSQAKPDETEQALMEAQLDKIISKIDNENTEYKKLLLHTHPLRTSPSSQGSSNETESDSPDVNPNHWETATTISDGVVVLTSNSSEDGDSSVEVLDLSFDRDTVKQFIDYDKKKLGQVHSNMNVRRCKSKLCGVCQKTKDICFVKARSKKKTSAVF